jgi:hypothetical protein
MPIRHTYLPTVSFAVWREMTDRDLTRLDDEIRKAIRTVVPDAEHLTVITAGCRSDHTPLVGQINAGSVTIIDGDVTGEINL